MFTEDVYHGKPSSGHPFFSPGSSYFVYYAKRLSDFDWPKTRIVEKVGSKLEYFEKAYDLARSTNERLVIVYPMNYVFVEMIVNYKIKRIIHNVFIQVVPDSHYGVSQKWYFHY